MPRPLRLEFENAWYHVMNRGSGSQNIYKNTQHGDIFLELLSDATKMFGIEVHAYCLMNNHYHLLIKTPRGNLSRAMRHINGVYTQRFNRMENTDGPLFRGRYSAILIDPEAYLLQVSRYIHQSPVNAKIANQPDQYKWSSYLYYLGKKEKPHWLYTDQTIPLLDQNQYKKFVEDGVDEETKLFYENTKKGIIFGAKDFKEKLLKPLKAAKIVASKPDFKRSQHVPSMQQINRQCAKYYNLKEKMLYASSRGKKNDARKIAIYACRVWGSEKLSLIAKQFNISSHALISNIVNELEKRSKNDKKLMQELNQIKALIHA